MPIFKSLYVRALSHHDVLQLTDDHDSLEIVRPASDRTFAITRHISKGSCSNLRTPYISATRAPYSVLRYDLASEESNGIAILTSSKNSDNICYDYYDASRGGRSSNVKLDGVAKQFASIDSEVVLKHAAVCDARMFFPEETWRWVRGAIQAARGDNMLCTQLDLLNAYPLSPVQTHRLYIESTCKDARGCLIDLPSAGEPLPTRGDHLSVALRAANALRRNVATYFGDAGVSEEVAAAAAAGSEDTTPASTDDEGDDAADDEGAVAMAAETPRLALSINRLGQQDVRFHRYYCQAARKLLEGRDDLGGVEGEGFVLLPGHEWQRLSRSRKTIRACKLCKRLARTSDAADQLIAKHVCGSWLA